MKFSVLFIIISLVLVTNANAGKSKDLRKIWKQGMQSKKGMNIYYPCDPLNCDQFKFG